MSDGIPCLWMRGGTSKAAVFLASDLPSDPAARDALLLHIFGSPDPRQIDGIGGGDPLTSKVAILSPSEQEDADVDYLFLQVFVDAPLVSDAQGCGNVLAAVGPAAIEMGLAPATDGVTTLRIRMVNTGETATSEVQTPRGRVSYGGATAIDGVPGTHAPVALWFENLEGSMAGTLLPTGKAVDVIDGVPCTLIDNGMPCVVMAAAMFGASGHEPVSELEAQTDLAARIEAIRLQAGPMMGLKKTADASVPKMVLVSPAQNDGLIMTRCWIPHRVHKSIGVFAAVTVATAALLPDGPAREAAGAVPHDQSSFRVEHPSGASEVRLNRDAKGNITSCGLTRTARKLMSGHVYPV